ncbi:MAG: MerR family transcriptional regulator [Acidimicrobiia bacterium]
MPDSTLDELADHTGEPVELLCEWRDAGLIGDPDRFGPEDAERVRLIRLLLRRGFTLETIVAAERHRERHRGGGLFDEFLGLMYPSGQFPTYSVAEAAEKAGVDVARAQRLWDAAGFSEHCDAASDGDVAALASLGTVLDAGIPEPALLEIVRVYSDTLRKVAEAEIRLFHFHVHERLRAAGVSGPELNEATHGVSHRLLGLVEPAVLYFHSKGWASAVRDDFALHVAEEAGQSEVAEVPGTLSLAVVFVDLSQFTPLTDVMGDAIAADIVDRFSNVVRASVTACHGRIVKQIGDAFMLVFFEPRTAVACALEIEERVSAEPQFPAVRSGAHRGPVLYRAGDYVGSTVNLASRLEAEAGPHQLLVTGDLRREAEGLEGVEFVPVGRRRFKGVSEDVEVFEARRAGAALREKLVDVVCGMELGPSEIAATLDVGGEERAFCSTACLQRFVAAPEQYAG